MSVRLKIGKVLNRTQSSYQLTKKLRPNIWRATYAGEQVIIKFYGNEGHFFNERYALACIKKENSVRQMIDGIEDSPVLVLEHLDDSLANVSRNKALDSGDLRHVTRNVLQALASLHQKQIGHMDVKPENLLVNLVTAGPGQFREVKLADLSFMTLLYNDDVLALGSYGNIFRSPELLLEAPFDASTDIRSLGAISLAWREAGSVTFLAPPAKALARGFTGDPDLFPMDPALERKPDVMMFKAEKISQRVYESRMKPLSFDEEVAKDSAGPVIAFIKRMMNMDPKDRPSAAELLQDEWITGEPL